MSPADDVAARLRAERGATEAQVASLTRDLADIVDAADLVATDDEHDPEGHTIAWERQQVAALLDAARAHRDALDAALARVDAGTYGRCRGVRPAHRVRAPGRAAGHRHLRGLRALTRPPVLRSLGAVPATGSCPRTRDVGVDQPGRWRSMPISRRPSRPRTSAQPVRVKPWRA